MPYRSPSYVTTVDENFFAGMEEETERWVSFLLLSPYKFRRRCIEEAIKLITDTEAAPRARLGAAITLYVIRSESFPIIL